MKIPIIVNHYFSIKRKNESDDSLFLKSRKSFPEMIVSKRALKRGPFYYCIKDIKNVYSSSSLRRRPARPRPINALAAAATIDTAESAVPVFGNSLAALRVFVCAVA